METSYHPASHIKVIVKDKVKRPDKVVVLTGFLFTIILSVAWVDNALQGYSCVKRLFYMLSGATRWIKLIKIQLICAQKIMRIAFFYL